MYDDLDRMAAHRGERTLAYKEGILSREVGSEGYAEKALAFESICCFREASLYWEYAYDLSRIEGQPKVKFKNRSRESMRVFEKLLPLLSKTVSEKRVGAIVGNIVFAHKVFEETLTGEVIREAKLQLPEDFEYDLAGYHMESGEFYFLTCPGFDAEEVPVATGGFAVSSDGSLREIRNQRVFKHKWMLVAPSYAGFSFYETVQNSINYNPKTGKINIKKVDKIQKKTTYIYALYDPQRNEEIRYVGKANDPKKRVAEHISEANKSPDLSDKTRWIAGLLAQGRNPEVKILEKIEYVYELEWGDVEYRYIQDLSYQGHSLTNVEGGGPRFEWGNEDLKLKMRRAIYKKTPTPDSKFKVELLKFELRERTRTITRLKKLKRLWELNTNPSLESRYLLRSVVCSELFYLVKGEGGSWCTHCGIHVKKGWAENNADLLALIFESDPILLKPQDGECPVETDQHTYLPCFRESPDHLSLSLEEPLYMGLAIVGPESPLIC